MTEEATVSIERRRFLKQAVIVAWATPTVLTISARRAGAQAASCMPNGGPCDACQGLACCDADPPDDGGCCCSDALAPGCGGVCVGVDADCADLNATPATEFRCYVPVPPGSASSRRSSGKGPKG